MKESIFNYHFLINNKEYIFNTNNGGLIEINPNGFTDEEKKILSENRFWVEDQYDEVCELEKETAQEIIEKVAQILSEHKYNRLRIHYYGGEPLLNLDVLLYFHERFKIISENTGIPYKPCLTTNGSMLTNELISSLNFDTIQLTFDGLAKTHNSLRVSDIFRFDEQVQLLGRILEHSDTQIRFRVNLCRQNRIEVMELYHYITEKYGKKRILFIPNRMIKFHEEDQFDMLSIKEYSDALLEIKDALSDEYKLPTPERTPCSFVCRNAFSIDTDGNCDFCETTKEKKSYKFKDIDVRKKRAIHFREECRNCKCLPICLGGCVVQYNLNAGSCTYEKYHMEHIITKYLQSVNTNS